MSQLVSGVRQSLHLEKGEMRTSLQHHGWLGASDLTEPETLTLVLGEANMVTNCQAEFWRIRKDKGQCPGVCLRLVPCIPHRRCVLELLRSGGSQNSHGDGCEAVSLTTYWLLVTASL